MRIKIHPENAEKIEAVLAAVNGKAQSFTVTRFSEVAAAARDAESKLATLPLGERRGVVGRYVPAGPSASSYRHAARSTSLKLERGARDWFLVGCERQDVYPKACEVLKIRISGAQADSIARRAIAGFSVAA